MGKHFSTVLPCMDANDLFVKTGFCPDIVRVVNLDTGLELLWNRALGCDNTHQYDATGDPTLATGQGVSLVKFTEMNAMDESSDPSTVESGQWNDANGIKIAADTLMLSDDDLLQIECWTMDVPMVRAIHDAGDAVNTYIQDSSLDFRDAGVSTGWIIYNKTNGDYAFVGEVQKPSGQSKHCRATLVDSNGDATTAADIDDDDVIYLFPKGYAGYPLSDIGAMS